MRFIPTRFHAPLDYIVGAALIAAPWIFQFSEHTAATVVLCGLTHRRVPGFRTSSARAAGGAARATTASAAVSTRRDMRPWSSGRAGPSPTTIRER